MSEDRKSLLDNLLKQISELFCDIEQNNADLREQTELLWKALKDKLLTQKNSDEVLVKDELCAITNEKQSQAEDKKQRTNTRKKKRQTQKGKTLREDLEHFWRKHKSPELIGKLYEQYVGSMYERKGFEVDYNGMKCKLEDEGRDLICIKGKRVVIVQCKNWSKGSQIHEKHIFQLLGTTIAYKLNNPYKDKKVYPVFVTSTWLSDVARGYAEDFHEEYHMVIREGFDGKQVIKCKITKTGEKIFYVPFDDEYFDIKVDLNNGDEYYELVEEAEEAGFRYAYAERYEQKGDD